MSAGAPISRDVIISVNVQPGKGNSKTTKDVKQQIDRLNRDIIQTETKTAKQSQQIDEKVIRNRLKLLARIEKDRQKAAKAEERRRQKEAREAQRLAERKAREEARLQEKIRKERERAAARAKALRERELADLQKQRERGLAEHEAANERRIASERQVLEASRTALQGAMDATRGLATLGIVGEENLEKFAKSFVKIQSGFDLFKGGIDVVFGVVDGMSALANVTKQAAAAQRGLNAAQAAGAALGVAGGAVGGAAGKAGGSAVGSVVGGAAGAAGVGVGGKVGALGASWFPTLASGSVFGSAALLGSGLAGGLVAGELGSAGLSRAFGGDGKGTLGVGFDAIQTMIRNSRQSARIKQMEEARVAAAQERAAAVQRAQVRGGLRRDFLATRDARAERMAAVGGADELTLARQARARAVADEQAALEERERARRIAEQRKGSGQFAFDEGQLSAAQELLEARERIAAADERAVQAIRSQVDERKRAVEQARAELSAARDLVKQEQSRADSALARFGKLGKGEQDTLRRIAEKRKSGEELSVQEASFLEKTGFGGDIAQDVFRRQGEAAGGRSVLEGLGELDGLKDAQRKAAQAAKDLEIAEAKRVEATEQLTQAQERFRQSLEAMAPVAERIANLQARIAGLEDVLDRINAKAGGDAGDEVAAAAAANSL